MPNHIKDEDRETEDREKGLSPFKGMINGFLAVLFMYSVAFLLIKWLKRVF